VHCEFPNMLASETSTSEGRRDLGDARDAHAVALNPQPQPRMSTIARVASGSVASWCHLAIGFATQLLLVPVVLSHWTPHEYGVWIGIAAAGSLIQFLDFGHHNYVGFEALRLGTRARDETSRLYRSAIRIALIASVVELALMGGLIWLGALDALFGNRFMPEGLSRDAGFVLILQSVAWLQGNWNAVAGRVLMPFGYYPQLVWFLVLCTVAATLAQVLALTLGAGLLAVGIVYHCTSAAFTSVATSYLRRAIAREGLAQGGSSYALGIANYARSLALSLRGVLEMLRREQFRLIVAPLVGPTALVLFMTSRTVANVLGAGLATIATPLTPELAQYLNLRDARKTASVMTVVWLLLVGALAPGAVTASFFIKPVFVTWTRGRIPFDAVLFALFSIGVLLLAFSQPAIAVLQCLNKVKLQVTISTLGTAVALTATFIAVPLLGVRGAAGSLLAAELIVAVSSVVALRRTFRSLGMTWPHVQIAITATSIGVSSLLTAWGSQSGAPAGLILLLTITVAVSSTAALFASLPASTRLAAMSFMALIRPAHAFRRKDLL